MINSSNFIQSKSRYSPNFICKLLAKQLLENYRHQLPVKKTNARITERIYENHGVALKFDNETNILSPNYFKKLYLTLRD
jgi:hypothetical protein